MSKTRTVEVNLSAVSKIKQMINGQAVIILFVMSVQCVAMVGDCVHSIFIHSGVHVETIASVYLLGSGLPLSHTAFSPNVSHLLCSKPRVEGLLTRGAMRAEDRPLWFDVYRAFPPAMEPKFARPKPTQPIKQIFYPEDKIRAKFHAANHGLGAVNMLSARGETHTGRLIKQYQTLQESGVPEDRLIEESVATLTNGEPTVMPKKPREEFAQPKAMNSVNVKNIFNDQ